jgi:integrase
MTTPIDFNHAEQCLDMLDGQDQLLFALMLYTGRRFSDVSNLRWEDIFEDKIVVKEQKTGKTAIITVNHKLRKILQSHTGNGYILHPKRKPGQRLTIQGANHRIKAIQAKLKLPEQSTHFLRKTFAKEVYRKHGITVASHLLNHDSEKTTRRYIGLTDEVIENVYQTL